MAREAAAGRVLAAEVLAMWRRGDGSDGGDGGGGYDGGGAVAREAAVVKGAVAAPRVVG